MKRLAVLALCALLHACGGGPSAPAMRQVAGVYTGQRNVTANTCGGSSDSLEAYTITVRQTGTTISIEIPENGIALTGTLRRSGIFDASAATVSGEKETRFSMNGFFSGNRLLASETIIQSIPGKRCEVTITFDMTRES